MSYYSAIILICLISLALLTVLVFENNRIDKKEKKHFYLAYAVIAAAASAEWAGIQLNGTSEKYIWLLQTVKCADYILTPIAGWTLALHIKHHNHINRLSEIFLVANTILQLISLFTGWMVQIDENGYYTHGPLYWIYMMIYSAIAVIVVIQYLLFGKNFKRRNLFSIIGILALAAFCITLQEISSGAVRTSYLGVVIGSTLLFIHYSEFRQLTSDEEIASQHADILLLQMRPHFLYNTMSSIYYLCDTDPQKAKQVTMDFTTYLRKNLNAISKTKTVLFKEELEHTKAYLAVELVRFEGQLFVEFDIPHTAFRLPPLTLQPIVENAVKHGVDPELDPLYVSVITRKTKNGSEITVEDTGPGFGANDNNEPHIALANITERLGMMCKGTLTISERENGGTKVTVYIPD